jgi:hypothetical protein
MTPTVTKTCATCQATLPVESFYMSVSRSAGGKTRVTTDCRPCYLKQRKRIREARRGQPFNIPIPTYLNYLHSKARYRKQVSFEKTDLLELWKKQKGLCALTGWEMTTRQNTGHVLTNMSIDRIDSTVGYELSNVQLVCDSANKAKNSLTEKDFVALCKAVFLTRGS